MSFQAVAPEAPADFMKIDRSVAGSLLRVRLGSEGQSAMETCLEVEVFVRLNVRSKVPLSTVSTFKANTSSTWSFSPMEVN
jgi:hypothetical protein